VDKSFWKRQYTCLKADYGLNVSAVLMSTPIYIYIYIYTHHFASFKCVTANSESVKLDLNITGEQ